MNINVRKTGCLIFVAIIAMGCGEERLNTPPVARLEVFPYAGDTTTIFTFDATGSSDNEDIKEKLTVRWDWNGDGIWDTGFESELKVLNRFVQKGMNFIRMELSDLDGFTSIITDSIRVFPIPVTGSVRDPRDGRVYKTVYLEGNWWMAESMKSGLVISSPEPQKNNGIIEFYAYDNDPGNIEKEGGLYSWSEAMQYGEMENSRGICPPGWHIPSLNEWKVIAPVTVPYLFLNYYYGPGGPGGLNLTYGGYYNFLYEKRNEGKQQYGFGGINTFAGFWTSSKREEKRDDFNGNIAWQQRNLSINISNVLDGDVPGSFDNSGLYVMGDQIHLRGNLEAYDRFAPYIVNATYAYFVRCAKDQ